MQPYPAIKGASGHPSLLDVTTELAGIFEKYPAREGRAGWCDLCAIEAAFVIRQAYLDYNIDIMVLRNPLLPGGRRPPMMRVKNEQGQLFTIAFESEDSGPFHSAVRIQYKGSDFIIDSLVYQHQGTHPMSADTYMSLWEYPADLEISFRSV